MEHAGAAPGRRTRGLVTRLARVTVGAAFGAHEGPEAHLARAKGGSSPRREPRAPRPLSTGRATGEPLEHGETLTLIGGWPHTISSTPRWCRRRAPADHPQRSRTASALAEPFAHHVSAARSRPAAPSRCDAALTTCGTRICRQAAARGADAEARGETYERAV